MEQSYKFRIYPTDEQIVLIIKTFGCARWTFNHFLKICNAALASGSPRPSYYACQSQLKNLKKEPATLWLAEPDKFAIANALRDLDKAFENYSRNPKHFGRPIMKSKKNPKQSYRTNYFKTSSGGNIEIDEAGGRIKLPKLAWVKASISRHVEGRILNVTVSRNSCFEYYASVTTTDVEFEQYEKTGHNAGIDVGLHELAVMSSGTSVPNRKRYKSKLRKLNASSANSRANRRARITEKNKDSA